ncbi:MAG: hypothetical protein Kow0025_26180 [Thermodesulfovibrionales bacterium]
MKKLLLITLVLAAVLVAYAGEKGGPPAGYQGATAERPQLVKGDKWEYSRLGRTASYEFVEEKEGQLVFEKVEDGTKTTEYYTPDLNLVKELDETGGVLEEVKPYKGGLSFPLWVGKKWSYKFSTTKREAKGSPGMLTEIESNVKVVGYEQVTVPAGTFWAFKVEEARRKAGKKMALLGKQRTIWYSPEVKRAVKTEEEDEEFNRELTRYSVSAADK